MIIKSFNKKGFGFFGQDVESWTENQNLATDLAEDAKNADKNHLSPFFKKYFPQPPKKILEGGCGTGKYVICYRKLGYDILGVDFSGDTIRRIKGEIDESLPVYEADVTALPFEDGYFDCYYSGGVIEHFEEGPDEPLSEARRVLKKGGILLATVPYVNLLRRARFSFSPAAKTEGFLQKRCEVCRRDTQNPEGYNFCEYFFDVKSLKPYFEANGFLIEKTYPTDFLWGEMGAPLRKRIANRKSRKEKRSFKPRETGKREALGEDFRTVSKKKSFMEHLIYDFFITENRNNMLFRWPLTFLNYLSGHLVLFIARAV